MSERVTAREVERQQFKRKVRGFDPEEVQLYLFSVSEEIERLNLENGRLLEENGRLAGRWGSAPIALVPAGPAEFMIGFLREGRLFDVAEELTLRILVEDGVSTGAEFLWEGRVFGEGVKVGG